LLPGPLRTAREVAHAHIRRTLPAISVKREFKAFGIQSLLGRSTLRTPLTDPL